MRALAVVVLFTIGCAAPSAGQGAIDLVPCADRFGESAMCGWHTVAEDRANPSGRQLDIRVVVLPARSASPHEPLLLFPGGPGQATTALIPLASSYSQVRETRDVIFIGQRGTGESNALPCDKAIDENPELAFGVLFDPEVIRACHRDALEHADPSFYTTEEYVADIASVLDAMDHDRVVLWGGSGGTRTALAFIREHEERVVAAALDGVVPIDMGMPGPFARFSQRAWDRVVADCEAQADCARAYPDLDEDLRTIFERLERGPATATIEAQSGERVEVEYGAGDFAYTLRGILYNANQTARLPWQVNRAAMTGDLSPFAQALYSRSAAIRGVLALGVHLSIYCAEDVPRMDVAAAQAEAEGTYMGTYLLEQYGAACGAWPVTPKPDTWYGDVVSDVPVLLLSGRYDPSTPDEAAEQVAATLSGSVHLVVQDVGHGAGFNCARVAVERFLASGSLDGFEDPCSGNPVRFEVPSEG